MKPFLLLATRFDDPVADAEYEAFRSYGGLSDGELVRVRLEQAPMPAIELDDYSGIIIGGGPFNASDPQASKSGVQVRVEEELGALVDRIVEADFPLLGACYGVGAVATRLGAKVDTRFGEPVSAVPITLTKEGKEDDLSASLPETFLGFVGHKEACSELPPGAVLLASSPLCPVQMFRYGRNLYVTQFHPELDTPGIVQRVRTYQDEGYFDPAELEAVIARVEGVKVTEPSRLLAAFVARYAR
ncbi:glutamine amidotransferase [Rarobacter faecitabidus]|uniref:GMP synthase (Glutamine-hydrolysing) n=1 Tax=Rarobacter faecitabidus TaxID=13243 RepID=A0A542ZX19_RARFA|nr:glutamine amidotransferase [Rarobacter faecitabidus]TQL64898.1 GMP synthase (glutamine-hydrolysing) [Rarobacter faecitabidus]